jgi:uncharacterized protein involved in exopolysaccharide biosynthesis
MTQNTPPTDDEDINWFALLQVVADNLRLLVLAPLTAGLIALTYTYTLPPSFKATTKFLPPQQQQSAAATMLQSLGPLAAAAGVSGGNNPGGQYVTFMQSHRLQDILIQRLKLTERFGTQNKEDTRTALAGRAQIANGKDGLIAVEVNDKDPQFAAQLANGYVDALRELLKSIAVTEAQQRRVFFENQLASAKDNLIKAEVALKSTGINSSTLKLSSGAPVERLASLQATIAAQEIKLASMRGYLTESAPDFKQAMVEMAALRAQLARTEKEEPSTDPTGNGYISKYRNYKYYETLFELFSKQYEVARVDESREGAIIQVLDVAEPPIRRNSAKRAQIASVTALAVGVLLLLFCLLRHALKTAAQNPQTASQLNSLRLSIRRAIGQANHA